MSRAEIRSAIATFLAPPAVAGLNSVFRSEPKIIQGQSFFSGAAPGVGTGAVGVVHIEKESESRRAIGGATSGKKRIDYEVALIIRFRSDLTSGTAAMDAYDTMLENLKVKLRSDRTLGSGVIFSAGEAGEQGGPDIEMISDLPVKEGQVVHIWTACRLPVPRRAVHNRVEEDRMRYKFIGESEEIFPDFSAVLQPGDTLETAEPVDHPRLELINGPAPPKPAPAAEAADTKEVG